MKLLDPDEPFPITDEDAKQYLLDDPSAQGLYDVYREQGHSIIEAMQKVLEFLVLLLDKQFK